MYSTFYLKYYLFIKFLSLFLSLWLIFVKRCGLILGLNRVLIMIMVKLWRGFARWWFWVDTCWWVVDLFGFLLVNLRWITWFCYYTCSGGSWGGFWLHKNTKRKGEKETKRKGEKQINKWIVLGVMWKIRDGGVGWVLNWNGVLK